MMQFRPSAPSPAGRPHLWPRPDSRRAIRGRRPRPAAEAFALLSLLFIPAALGLRLAIHAGGVVAWTAMVLMPVAAGFAGFWLGRLSRKRMAEARRDRG